MYTKQWKFINPPLIGILAAEPKRREVRRSVIKKCCWGSKLCNPALVHNKDVVGRNDGLKAVSHREHGRPRAHLAEQSTLDSFVSRLVDGGRGLVKHGNAASVRLKKKIKHRSILEFEF